MPVPPNPVDARSGDSDPGDETRDCGDEDGPEDPESESVGTTAAVEDAPLVPLGSVEAVVLGVEAVEGVTDAWGVVLLGAPDG